MTSHSPSVTWEQELQILHQGEVSDRRDLHGELEAVQSEHVQRLGEVQQEQRKLKSRLDQLRQQGCRCKDAPHQETIYAKQVPITLTKLEPYQVLDILNSISLVIF